MTPAAEQAEYVAQALCPGKGLEAWQVRLLAEVIDKARGEGAAAAEADLQPMLNAAANTSERAMYFAKLAEKRAWDAMLAAFGLGLYVVLRAVLS